MNTLLTLHEINQEAFSILFKELGISKTIRFINQFHIGKGNYVEMKEEIFRGMSVDDIVAEVEDSF